ncbi:hypothetical protein RRSWK_04393 [Rhodopirellula sp. SWK7]|nr:hypothetical protein RRSWK_04393 [Rhodopirellula sp. SWK7]
MTIFLRGKRMLWDQSSRPVIVQLARERAANRRVFECSNYTTI